MLLISGAQKKAGIFNSWGFHGGSVVKNPSANADLSSIPGSGRSPGEGNGTPLQYSSPEAHGWRSLEGYRVGHNLPT